MTDIKSMNFEELKEKLVAMGEKKKRPLTGIPSHLGFNPRYS